jgi:O-antigen ligase
MYFFEGHRNYSIFSWVDLNSLGVTFPILIAILLNYYENNNLALFFLVFSTIVVCFLSQTRYTMISGVLVLFHLIITAKYSVGRKISILAIIVGSILLLGTVAYSVGIDIQEIINDRIMEKGTDISESSAGARITSYNVFVKKFPEHPWFGVGPHTRPDVQAMLGEGVPIIHVGYLSYLYYYGIAGCFFFFFSLVFLLRDAFIVGLKYKFWGSFYGLFAFCLANATFVYFNLSEAGIVLAVSYLKYYKSGAFRLREMNAFESTELRTVI